MTLPELLICVVLLGLLTTVVSAAIVVTLRQQDSTTGRLNLSAAEQSVGMWMPNDLASAQSVTKNPGASPCGAPVCDGIDLSAGSNVLMLTWSVEVATATGTELVTTNVSYHMAPSDDGETFELWRVECVQSASGWECSFVTLLRDLPGPPAGSQPSTWTGGVAYGPDYCVPPATEPAVPPRCSDGGWVIGVSLPLSADATEDRPENYATGDAVKDANRVIVTIDGGGGGDDASGGKTRISITAGGTNRATIDANSLLGTPSFEEARSRCGGPLSLIVDESTSISQAGADNAVLGGIRTFVETLVGTPVELQIIEFDAKANVVQPNGGNAWHHYFDMLDIDGDVKRLLTDRDLNGSPDSGLIGQMTISGDTNWEDALFRAFYNDTGGIPDIYPETVVFFTDGAPTADRQMGSSYKTGGDLAGQPSYSRPPYANYSAGTYNQASYNRAAYVATQNRAKTRLVGVGVGGINDPITWVSSPGTGFVYEWERGFRRYQHVTSTTVYEKASALSTNLDFERYRSSWGEFRDTDPADYFDNNTSSHTSQTQGSDNRRINSNNGYRRSGSGAWQTVSYSRVAANLSLQTTLNLSSSWYRIDSWSGDQGLAAYNAAPTAEKTAGLWRQQTVPVITWVTEAVYNANNNPSAVPANSDGWVDAGQQWATSDAEAVEWQASSAPSNPNPTSTTDGYRATQTYPVTPPSGGYTGYTPATTESKTGSKILANLVAGDDIGTPYVKTPVDNSAIANMYVLPPVNQGGFSQLGPALKSVALGECGGTLTLQTKVATGTGTTNARDPFTYQNTAAWDSSGQPINGGQKTKTTNQQFPAGTFDFTVPGGTTVTVEIRPSNFAELSAYTPQGWSCRAGITPITDFETFPIMDTNNQPTGWSGIRVPITANSAVSCTLTVTN